MLMKEFITMSALAAAASHPVTMATDAAKYNSAWQTPLKKSLPTDCIQLNAAHECSSLAYMTEYILQLLT